MSDEENYMTLECFTKRRKVPTTILNVFETNKVL